MADLSVRGEPMGSDNPGDAAGCLFGGTTTLVIAGGGKACGLHRGEMIRRS
jgi:hypothetical protein